jgi:Cu+-exporting ATPase
VGSALVLGSLILRLALRDLIRFVRELGFASARDTVEISVAGMTCNGCVNKLEAALLEVDGVLTAVVTRNPDRALVRGFVDRGSIDRAIIGAGYRAVSS